MLLSSARHMNSLTAVAYTAGASQAEGAECYALIKTLNITFFYIYNPELLFYDNAIISHLTKGR